MTIRTALLACAVLAAVPAAAAERTVPANRTTELAFLNVYNTHGCRYGARPKLRLRQPEHGRITTRWLRRPYAAGPSSQGAEKCKGRDMYGLAVYYTPDRGYRGPDDYYLRWTYQTASGYRGFLGGRERLVVR